MKHPLLPLPERTKEKDAVYAVLGRALAYASEFENNCRRLAHLLEIEEPKSDFMFEIWNQMENGNLYQKINQLIGIHELPEWSAEEIHKARKARNRIAHEIGLQHKELMNTEESIRYYETDILLTVQEIITGNQIVMDVTRLVKESRSGHGSDVVAYHGAVCDWILR
jgi:hypothetical protein